jgi:hypothetical protein
VPTAARTGVEGTDPELSSLVTVVVGRDSRDCDQLTAEDEFLGAMTIAEKTVVANAMKAVRQGVQQEAPDELVGRQGHYFALVVMPVIAPAETHLLSRRFDQTAVRDGDAVRVAPEIAQDRRGAGERALGIDDPLGAPQFAQASGKDRCGGETGQRAKELQSAGLERRFEVFQEQPAEQPREDAHRQEEAGSASNPAPAVRGQAAAGNEAVNVRMVAPTPTIP